MLRSTRNIATLELQHNAVNLSNRRKLEKIVLKFSELKHSKMSENVV